MKAKMEKQRSVFFLVLVAGAFFTSSSALAAPRCEDKYPYRGENYIQENAKRDEPASDYGVPITSNATYPKPKLALKNIEFVDGSPACPGSIVATFEPAHFDELAVLYAQFHLADGKLPDGIELPAENAFFYLAISPNGWSQLLRFSLPFAASHSPINFTLQITPVTYYSPAITKETDHGFYVLGDPIALHVERKIAAQEEALSTMASRDAPSFVITGCLKEPICQVENAADRTIAYHLDTQKAVRTSDYLYHRDPLTDISDVRPESAFVTVGNTEDYDAATFDFFPVKEQNLGGIENTCGKFVLEENGNFGCNAPLGADCAPRFQSVGSYTIRAWISDAVSKPIALPANVPSCKRENKDPKNTPIVSSTMTTPNQNAGGGAPSASAQTPSPTRKRLHY